MLSRIWLKLAEILVPAILAITIFVAWNADRRDRSQLATQLAAAQQTIAQATANQHDRDTLLNQTLAQIAAQKQAAVTPTQILKDLPSALPLPAPVTVSDPSLSDGQDLPSNPSPKSNPSSISGQPADAVLPAADLKPLYDFALDCKACQARLAASLSDLTDEKTKTRRANQGTRCSSPGRQRGSAYAE